MSTPSSEPSVFEIIVNATPHKVTERVQTFAAIVKIAFPTPPPGGEIVYTVTFRNADGEPSSGNLTAGGSVKIKLTGTVFNVTATDKS